MSEQQVAPEKRRPNSKGQIVTAVHLHGGKGGIKVDLEIGGRWYRVIEDRGCAISHITELWTDREYPCVKDERYFK